MRDLFRNRLRALLFLSVALNLFFVGIVAARFAGVDIPGISERVDRRGYRELPHPRTLRAALPSSDQALLEQTLEAHRDSVRTRFRALNEARQRVADAIRAVPFDAVELEKAFADLRQRDADTAASIHGMLGALVADLDADSRARVADTIHVWRPKERKSGEGEGAR